MVAITSSGGSSIGGSVLKNLAFGGLAAGCAASRVRVGARGGVKAVCAAVGILAFLGGPAPALGASSPEEPGRLELLLFAQDLPTTVQPGRIEKQFEEPSKPKSQLEPVIPEGEEAALPEELEQVRFVLSGLMVEGATVYADAEFLPLYEDMLGQEVSLRDVYGVAGKISAKYRNDGYILSQAVVPAQRIRDGIVRIQVVEGYINEVIIDGEIAGRESLLEAFARKITASRPLRGDTLERYLLLADDLPGMTAKAVLTPSADQPGASDLVLFVEHKRIDHSYGFDNRGTRFVGPFQFSGRINVNSFLGLYEQTSARAIFATEPEELRFIQLTHSETLGSEGTRLIMSYNVTRSRPGFTLETQNAQSDSQELTFILAHPIIRSRSENLSIKGTFAWKKSLVDFQNLALFDDRLRVVRAGASYDVVDRFRGVNLIEFEVSQGLDIFNESTSGSNDGVDPELSRENGKSNFFKVTAKASRLQSLAVLLPGLNLLGAVSGQFSGSQLLSAEEFGFGGAEFGRAYDASEIVGDHGAAGKIELQYGRSPVAEFLTDYQLYAYYDYGMVWRINASDLGTKGKVSESAASAGLGVRFNVTENLTGYIEVDTPLTRAVAAEGLDDAGEPRVFFSVGARF